MTIDEQDKLVLEATLMKLLGSGRDKHLWLEARGWESKMFGRYYKSTPFLMGYRSADDALDDEVGYALTGNPYFRGEKS